MEIKHRTSSIVYVLFLLLFPTLVVAQIVTQDGETYASELSVKFRLKAFDTLDPLTSSNISEMRNELLSAKKFFQKYGEVRFKKVFSETVWGDTVKVNHLREIIIIPDLSQFYTVIFPKPVKMWRTVYELRKIPEIGFADPPILTVSELVPNDPYFQPDQWNLAKVNATSAWNITTGSSSIMVAVIDVGVEATHTEFSNKLTGGESGTHGGHGTSVAGIVGAATNNGVGIASLGWNVKVMPYDFLNQTKASSDISAAVGAGAHVINCSWNTVAVDPNDNTKYINYDDSSVRQAIQSAVNQGRVVVAAAGNPPEPVTFPDGITRNPKEFPPYLIYPAAYNGVIAVSATNSSDGFPSGYNYGSHVDVSAPSISILTTYLNNSYITGDRTSLGTPLVAALAGLIRSKNQSFTATQVANTIYLAADDLGASGWDDHFGYGRINAYKAVRNLYVPQVYSTISSALSAATSGQAVVVGPGSHNVGTNLTVASGVNLEIKPGATLNFTDNYKLRVEGTLTANGTYTNKITFTRSGGTWYGIEFWNGDYYASEIKWANINNAQYGVRMYNTDVALADNSIEYNTVGLRFENQSEGRGVTSGNVVAENSSYGIECIQYSDPLLFPFNVIRDNGYHGVYGDNTSVPDLGRFSDQGHNSLYYNVYDVWSTYPWTINALYNWWGSYPAYPPVTDNVDWSNPLDHDPNSGMGKLAANAVSSANPSRELKGNTAADTLGMAEVNRAHQEFLDGKYGQALTLFEGIVQKYPDHFAGRRALAFLNRSIMKLTRQNEIVPRMNAVVAAYPGLEIAGLANSIAVGHLIKSAQYAEAIAKSQTILSDFPKTILAKYALYDLGSIYWYRLEDQKTGETYYRQLIAEWPDDDLTISALATLGEWKPAPGKGNAPALTNTQNVPAKYALSQNFPNPFNPQTMIHYQLPEVSRITLKIYNLFGQEVRTLITGQREAGYHSEIWDGRDDFGRRVASGVYFYRLSAAPNLTQPNGFQFTRKMVLTQ